MKNQTLHFALVTKGRFGTFLHASIGMAWLQLRRWWQLSEQRRKLALLDEHALHDLGLSRADVIQESERPFWDDPLAK